MKKILTGFVFCLSITSCSLDTIPTSQYVEDNFWKTPEQIEAGLVACYSTMYNVYMYGSNLIFSETGTPNAYNYNGTYGWRVIGDGSVNSINSDIVNGKWGACYQGIGRCNTFIAGAPSFVISEEDKKEMVGEAKFLRALFYFDLTNMYGDAPLILDKPDVNTQSFLPRDPKAKIIAQVIQDLKDAFSALPATSSQTGRANKWAAKALLARVYLYNEMWEEAEKAAEEVINSKKYSLFSDYRNLFSRDHENNQEVIFDVQYLYPTFVHSGNGLDVVLRQFNSIAPTLDLVKAYDMKDGSSYTDGKDLYIDRDPRFYATIVHPGATYMGQIVTNDKFINTGYTFKKYSRYDTAAATIDDKNDINIILMRYADILMIYAEARNERLDKPDQPI